jgi:hypothetical protein
MRSLLLAILCLLAIAPAAGAASIAYIDGGEVWLSSMDGTQKVRLAAHVVNSSGETEKWIAVAHSDGGRIVAVRNFPGRSPRFASFKVWEPSGISTVGGLLNAPVGWVGYDYPLGFDVSADGTDMAYGYRNTSTCCPETVGEGTYVRPVSNGTADPTDILGQAHPTLFGSRVIAHAGSVVDVQSATGSPYGTAFTPWLDTAATGLAIRRTDVAANAELLALELEGPAVGKISLLSMQSVDQDPTFPAAVDCYVPASGVAGEPSLSADATRLVWTDAQGLKVAGTPTSAAEPCVLTTAPVVISATATQGAIGGASLAPFLPAAQEPGPIVGSTPTPLAAAPVVTLPKRVTRKALARPNGVAAKVKVTVAGKVKLSGTVAAKALRRKGKRVVIAIGSATAKGAGTITVRLRLNKTGRTQRKRLKGAKMTLRVTQGKLSTTKRVTLR